jgi:hypothetical protein
MNGSQVLEIQYRLIKILGGNKSLSQRRTATGIGVSLGKDNCRFSERASAGSRSGASNFLRKDPLHYL